MVSYKRYILITAQRLSILLLLYTICRLLFYFLNRTHFPNTGIAVITGLHLAGIRFDISSILLLNSPFIFFSIFPAPWISRSFYQTFLRWLFYIANGAGLALNCIDMGYFPFTLKRLTWDFLQNIFHPGNFAGILSYVHGYWYIFLIFGILLWVMQFLYRWIDGKNPLLHLDWIGGTAWVFNFSGFLISTAIVVLGIRGGWQLAPISNMTVGEYTGSENSAILLNSPFSILNTRGLERLEEKKYMSAAECTALFNPIQYPVKGSLPQLKNVVLIILESFSKEFTMLGKQKSYTPFFDSIMKEGYVFTNAFANGKSSAEGIPAILSSVPSLMQEPFSSSVYGSEEVTSMASLLKSSGYNSSFFHGGSNGTMNFQAFTGLAKFDQYYGRKEYNNEADFDGNWGIWDEPFLQFFASRLNTFKEPFLSAVFTLSSHDPFLVPDKYADKFPSGNRTINPCIGYADYSLRRFFETAKKAAWFRNTIFVFTADHTGYSDDPYWGNMVGQYSIPICFYTPDGSLKGSDSTLVQQIDILPTLLSVLGYQKSYFSFGRNAFDKAQNHFGINFKQDEYRFYMGKYMLRFNGKEITGFYDLRKDSLLKSNLSSNQSPEMLNMHHLLKAYIQTYNERLLHNQMIIK